MPENKNISRRDFLKAAGIGSIALTVPGCAPKPKGTPPRQGEMQYRLNPANGDRVSLLGYGCMRWPMKKDENGKDIIDQDKVNELVDHAIANGVNYFDTSPAYLQGLSEKATAIALSRHPRQSYYLATKLSNFGDYSRKASIQMYEDSFKELNTDYIDYYLLHSIGRGGYKAFAQRYEENGLMDFLLEERKKGKIRQLGFSFHGNKQAFNDFMALHEKYHWDFVQIEMNYVDWTHADGVKNVNADYLYSELDKRKIPITVMEPLLGGRLANVPDNIADKLKERDPEATIASWAFRFVGTFPRVLTVLSGMTYMEHLKDNLLTYKNFKPLNPEELGFLEEMAVLMKEYPTINCTDCKYCMPCPYGVNIPEVFRHYNECINKGEIAQSEAQKEYRRLRRAYLISYDRAVPPLRQANHCIGCDICLDRCPQSIAISHEMRRIDNYVEKLKRSL